MGLCCCLNAVCQQNLLKIEKQLCSMVRGSKTDIAHTFLLQNEVQNLDIILAVPVHSAPLWITLSQRSLWQVKNCKAEAILYLCQRRQKSLLQLPCPPSRVLCQSPVVSMKAGAAVPVLDLKCVTELGPSTVSTSRMQGLGDCDVWYCTLHRQETTSDRSDNIGFPIYESWDLEC